MHAPDMSDMPATGSKDMFPRSLHVLAVPRHSEMSTHVHVLCGVVTKRAHVDHS